MSSFVPIIPAQRCNDLEIRKRDSERRRRPLHKPVNICKPRELTLESLLGSLCQLAESMPPEAPLLVFALGSHAASASNSL